MKFVPRPTTQCITIAPGGYLGMYMLGTLVYIKNNFVLEEYMIGGVSAGAILSLYAASSRSDVFLFNNLIIPFVDDVNETKWSNLLNVMKERLNVVSESVDRDRVFMSATRVQFQYPILQNVLKTTFDSNEEMVSFAIASAFVPFLCGLPATEYNAAFYVDGAITGNNPIPENCEQVLYISPSMWGREFTWSDCVVIDRDRAIHLLKNGFQDAKKNRMSIPLKKRHVLTRVRNKFLSLWL